MATYHNYNIKQSNGRFYQTSKQQEEGYTVKFETKSGEIRYHKEQDEIRGVLSGIQIKELNNGQSTRKYLEIRFDEPSGAYGSLLIPIFDARKSVDDWIKAFIPSGMNLKKGMDIILSLNRKEKHAGKDGKQYLWKNIYFKNAGTNERIDWSFERKDVPKAVQKTNEVTGDPEWDFKEQDKFYYEKVKALVARFESEPSSPSESTHGAVPQGKPYTGAEEAPIEGEGSYDDLPF